MGGIQVVYSRPEFAVWLSVGEIEHSTWLDNQVKWREKTLEKEAQKELRLAKKRLKWCNHVDSSSGLQCRTYKSQKSIHDQDYCYKHQPKR